MDCFFDTFPVVTIDTALYSYPNIIVNLLRIFEMESCVHQNKIYTVKGTITEISPSSSSSSCNCENFLFEINLLYYIYRANQCMLFEGKIQNQIFSMTSKKMILVVESDDVIENTTINQNQTSEKQLEMIDLDDPTVQNTMSTIYLKTFMSVMKAFEKRGLNKNVQFKNPDLEEEIFNQSGYIRVETYEENKPKKDNNQKSLFGFLPLGTYIKNENDTNNLSNDVDNLTQESRKIMEKSFDNVISEDLETLLAQMVVTTQVMMVTVDFDTLDASNLTINMSQSSVEKIVIEKIGDGLLSKFFDNIFSRFQKYNQNCSESTNSESKTVIQTESNNLYLYILLGFLVILLLVAIIVLILVSRKEKMVDSQQPTL